MALNDIEHRKTRVGRPRGSSFAERPNGTALDEFLRKTLRRKPYALVEKLQEAPERWPGFYNHRHPHQTYRNLDKRLTATIREFVDLSRNKAC